jgi:hypothetical protein
MFGRIETLNQEKIKRIFDKEMVWQYLERINFPFVASLGCNSIILRVNTGSNPHKYHININNQFNIYCSKLPGHWHFPKEYKKYLEVCDIEHKKNRFIKFGLLPTDIPEQYDIALNALLSTRIIWNKTYNKYTPFRVVIDGKECLLGNYEEELYTFIINKVSYISFTALPNTWTFNAESTSKYNKNIMNGFQKSFKEQVEERIKDNDTSGSITKTNGISF